MPSYKEIISSWRRKATCKAEDVYQEFKDFHILLAYHSEKLDNDEIDYVNIRNIFEDNRLKDYTVR